MQVHIKVDYSVHPIGQGLFSTGAIAIKQWEPTSLPVTCFHWVYDCGSLSHRSNLRACVDKHKESLDGQSIGLFCLSHFDADHVNGATEYLRATHVEVIALPYLTLVERMAIAAYQQASGEFLRFLAEPAAFIVGVSANKSIQVVLVDGGGSAIVSEDDAADVPANPDGPPLQIPQGRDPYTDESFTSGTGSPMSNVRVINDSEVLRLSAIWEFAFYNERQTSPGLENLRPAVLKLLQKHQTPGSGLYDDYLVPELIAQYGRSLGRTGLQKNRISLVMFTGLGPVERPPWHVMSGVSSVMRGGICTHSLALGHHGGAQISILYTGDAYLSNVSKLRAVASHFQPERWRKLLVMQMPHHGSRHSWFSGGSTECYHTISVITAKSGSIHHPARSVMLDVINRQPTLVDEHNGLQIQIELDLNR